MNTVCIDFMDCSVQMYENVQHISYEHGEMVLTIDGKFTWIKLHDICQFSVFQSEEAPYGT